MLRRVLLVHFVSVLAVAGFGSGESMASAPARSQTALLRDGEWVLDQKASTLEAVVPSAVITARFSSNRRLAGSAGCNDYNAAYRIVGRRMRINQNIATTTKACAESVMNAESAYLERLPQVRSFRVRGSALTLETSTKGAPLVYHAVRAPDALVGPWVVTSYFRPGAVTSVIVGTTLTANFGDTLSGNAGCNDYSGPYTAKGTTISIGPLASTLRLCADPAVDQQETDYLAALQLAKSFRIDSNGLTLLRGDGGIAVQLARS
jgi:heat shock protein HslJ